MLQFGCVFKIGVKIFYVYFYYLLEGHIMQIKLFTQKYSLAQNINSVDSRNNKYQAEPFNNTQNLPSVNSVSFGAAYFSKARTVQDALEEQFMGESARLLGIGKVYNAVLKDIASNSDGIFKISDNIEHLVKNAETRVKKIIRSGSMKVHDIIRQTAYCENPYNFDNLLYLIKEMETCRYVLDMAPMEMGKLMKRGYMPSEEEYTIMTYLTKPKGKNAYKNLMTFFEENGYSRTEIKKVLEDLQQLGHTPTKEEFYDAFVKVSKNMPDLDIRLNPKMITPEQIKKLPEEYRYCIGKPQDSGYEDIQMRFVRSYVQEKSKQVPHELIILFGENYHKSKSRESHFIYSHLRKIKELGVKRFFENEKYDNETRKVKTYIELIEEMFRGKVSRKEYLNGRNKDFMKDKHEVKIVFTEDDETLAKGYFEGLLREIGKPYGKAINKTAKDKRKPLKDALRADRETIKSMQAGLKESIDAYNSGKAYEYTSSKTRTKKKKLDESV